jgi:hypothetical protein
MFPDSSDVDDFDRRHDASRRFPRRSQRSFSLRSHQARGIDDRLGAATLVLPGKRPG